LPKNWSERFHRAGGRKYKVPLTKSKMARFIARYSAPIKPAIPEFGPNTSASKDPTEALPFLIS
jgi:hypothetical protein